MHFKELQGLSRGVLEGFKNGVFKEFEGRSWGVPDGFSGLNGSSA